MLAAYDDLKKEFDSLDREEFWDLLCLCGISARIIGLLTGIVSAMKCGRVYLASFLGIQE